MTLSENAGRARVPAQPAHYDCMTQPLLVDRANQGEEVGPTGLRLEQR